MKFVLIFILVVLISNVSAICEESQIDINNASLEELDQLYSIGPVKAQAIIDTRPFNSTDDLIIVSGIGKVALENIKNQGLACVNKESEEILEGDILDLSPKTIKSEEKSENLGKKDFAIYGLIAFCILLAFFIWIKIFE